MDTTTAAFSGEGSSSSSEEFEIIGLPFELAIVVCCCIFLTFAITVILCMCCWCKRQNNNGTRHISSTKSKGNKNSYLNMAVPVDGASGAAGTPQKPSGNMKDDIMDKLEQAMKKQIDSFQIESRRLTLGTPIGSGRFGVVYKATLKDKDMKNPQEVAAKTVQGADCDEKEVTEFLEEVIRMRGFHHRNVLCMMGLVLKENKPFAVLPYMKNGDLRGYLKEKTRKLVVRDLVEMCNQICEGMTYLSEQGFVHRDLATRNCMVDEGGVIKIGDFGLSRDIFSNDYYRMSNLDQPLPVRWMAVESMTEQVFTVKTDVWAYGVVIWEIMTRGQTPFTDKESPDVVKYVKLGGRLPQPQYCPDEIFEVMKECWKEFADDRPSFRQLSEHLRTMLGGPASKAQKKRDKYYNLTEVHAFQTNKKSPAKKGSKSK